LVLGKGHKITSSMGSLPRNGGRQTDTLVKRSRGLYLGCEYFSTDSAFFRRKNYTPGGYVFQSGKCKTSKILHKVAPPSKFSGGCSEMRLDKNRSHLCKSPVEGHSAMVGETHVKQKRDMPSGGAYVGFRTLVAPINQNGSTKNKNVGGPAQGRALPKLLGRIDAQAKMAPGLFDCIRFLLEQQEMEKSTIQMYLTHLGNLRRYDSAFRKLFVLLKERFSDPLQVEVHQVAQEILKMYHVSSSDARNAYSAVCLLPGFQHIRFSPLLTPLKKSWNTSQQKYATFWDPSPILQSLSQRPPLQHMSLEMLRESLILTWRLLALHRGVDLSRTSRTISTVGPDCFVLIRRKGWKTEKWEQVLKISERPQISPFHLMLEYVRRTAHCVPQGGALLYSLDGKKPLSSNRINSITKEFLSHHGIPTSHWQAHSTRGAGVLFYKKLGLSSEEVCEVGQWRNSEAFTKHYLRLGAVKKVATVVGGLVHTFSPRSCAEPEWSQTPGKNDQGGSDHEGGAQERGEPTHPTQKRTKEIVRPQPRKKLAIRPSGGPLRFAFAIPVSGSSPTPAPKSQ
jgi:hypothetical protein